MTKEIILDSEIKGTDGECISCRDELISNFDAFLIGDDPKNIWRRHEDSVTFMCVSDNKWEPILTKHIGKKPTDFNYFIRL